MPSPIYVDGVQARFSGPALPARLGFGQEAEPLDRRPNRDRSAALAPTWPKVEIPPLRPPPAVQPMPPCIGGHGRAGLPCSRKFPSAGQLSAPADRTATRASGFAPWVLPNSRQRLNFDDGYCRRHHLPLRSRGLWARARLARSGVAVSASLEREHDTLPDGARVLPLTVRALASPRRGSPRSSG